MANANKGETMDAEMMLQAMILYGGALQPERKGTSVIDDISDVDYFETLTTDKEEE